MHYGIVLLMLAVGTFVFFPRIARGLVALGLIGCFVVVAIVGYQLLESSMPAVKVSAVTLQADELRIGDARDAQFSADYAFITNYAAAQHEQYGSKFTANELTCELYGETRPIIDEVYTACRQAMLALREERLTRGQQEYAAREASASKAQQIGHLKARQHASQR